MQTPSNKLRFVELIVRDFHLAVLTNNYARDDTFIELLSTRTVQRFSINDNFSTSRGRVFGDIDEINA